MAKKTVQTTLSDPLEEGELVMGHIDSEIEDFERWFAERANGPLTGFEREILRSYLYWKLKR